MVACFNLRLFHLDRMLQNFDALPSQLNVSMILLAMWYQIKAGQKLHLLGWGVSPSPLTKQPNNSIQEHVQQPKVLQDKPYDRNLMYVKYQFQSGPTTKISHHFPDWWRKHYVYPGSPLNNVSLSLLPKTNSTLEQLLLHKKPPREILQRMDDWKTW